MLTTPQHLLVPMLLSLLFVFIISLHKWLSKPPSKAQKLPISPTKLPLIGNLHQLGAHPHRKLRSLSEHYGGLMLLHFGRVPFLVASSSDMAREIMKNQDLTFSNRPRLRIPDKLFYGSSDVAFAPYGEHWRQVKSLCTLQLLSKRRVQSFHRVREQETSIMVERIKQSNGSSSSAVINLSDLSVSLTNDVICRVAFGRKYSDDGKSFDRLLTEFMKLLGTTSIKDYIPWLGFIDSISGLDARVERVSRKFDEFLEDVIQVHKSNRDKPDSDQDFVDILLQLQKERESVVAQDNTVKALILEMFGAGTDTTSAVLVWTMAELIRNPETMQKLQTEVRGIARSSSDHHGIITEDDLDKMHYLRAAIKESLRLHAPIPLLVPRESTRPTKLMGYDIPKGTRVMINAWAIGRDPSIWKDPEKFEPERFLDSDVDYRGFHFELIPFGAGRRGCPGTTFAEAVIELALAKLVCEFDFKLSDGESAEDLDMSEGSGIAAHKRLPLLVVATPPKCVSEVVGVKIISTHCKKS